MLANHFAQSLQHEDQVALDDSALAFLDDTSFELVGGGNSANNL